MKQLLCAGCGAALRNAEIALNLKLRGRSIGTFFCMGCLARQLGCGAEELKELAAFFRQHGCELFERIYVNE